jgi:hypothetical protein
METLSLSNALSSYMIRKGHSSEYVDHLKAYFNIALKAQNQCRMTLETLSEIKNPKPYKHHMLVFGWLNATAQFISRIPESFFYAFLFFRCRCCFFRHYFFSTFAFCSCSLIQASTSVCLNRQAPPTLNPGSFPSDASLYAVFSASFKY